MGAPMGGFIMAQWTPAGLSSAEGELQHLLCSCSFATWAMSGSGAPSSPSLLGCAIPEAVWKPVPDNPTGVMRCPPPWRSVRDTRAGAGAGLEQLQGWCCPWLWVLLQPLVPCSPSSWGGCPCGRQGWHSPPARGQMLQLLQLLAASEM